MVASQRAERLTFYADAPPNTSDWVLIPNSWNYIDYHVELSIMSDHRVVVVKVSPK